MTSLIVDTESGRSLPAWNLRASREHSVEQGASWRAGVGWVRRATV